MSNADHSYLMAEATDCPTHDAPSPSWAQGLPGQCFKCGKNGHWAQACPNPNIGPIRPWPKYYGKGHGAIDCPCAHCVFNNVYSLMVLKAGNQNKQKILHYYLYNWFFKNLSIYLLTSIYLSSIVYPSASFSLPTTLPFFLHSSSPIN